LRAPEPESGRLGKPGVRDWERGEWEKSSLFILSSSFFLLPSSLFILPSTSV